MTSIFDNEKNKIKSKWWQKNKIGDKIEGTLVDKRIQQNQLSGKDQSIYELKLSNGEYWNVGGSIAIDAQMRQVKLGQIVGFEFIEERPSKKSGLNPTKVIQVWADPKIVDEEWIRERETMSTQDNMINNNTQNENNPVDNVSFVNDIADTTDMEEKIEQPQVQPTLDTSPSPTTKLTTPEYISKISTLVQEKFGLTDPNEIKTKVMEETQLPFVESNLPDILKKLEEI